MGLTIAQESPEIAVLFGLVAVTTGVLLLAIPGGTGIPQIALIILGIFWIMIGSTALWFGWKYLRIRL